METICHMIIKPGLSPGLLNTGVTWHHDCSLLKQMTSTKLILGSGKYIISLSSQLIKYTCNLSFCLIFFAKWRAVILNQISNPDYSNQFVVPLHAHEKNSLKWRSARVSRAPYLKEIRKHLLFVYMYTS